VGLLIELLTSWVDKYTSACQIGYIFTHEAAVHDMSLPVSI
jgi:hypothetical protein